MPLLLLRAEVDVLDSIAESRARAEDLNEAIDRLCAIDPNVGVELFTGQARPETVHEGGKRGEGRSARGKRRTSQAEGGSGG